MVPLSFVSDHIETLYEVDMLFAETRAEGGDHRLPAPEALNSHPVFIEALARLVEGKLEERA